MSCECNIAGLLSTNYSGIYSASLNGSSTIELAEDGTVLLGQTTNTISIQAWPFSPGGDVFLGCTCASQVSVNIEWLIRYDCVDDTVYFIPKLGGKANTSGDLPTGVTILCDPNIIQRHWDANASGGPSSVVITTERKDFYGLRWSGGPINVDSSDPNPYTIRVGNDTIQRAYLQSFSISVSPPNPATCSYSFVFAG